jgi:hypothetical protein
MDTHTRNGRANRRAVALIVTLVFLALFACMALAITTAASSNLAISHNRVDACQAAALAETGIRLIQYNVGGLAVPGTHSALDLHNAVTTQLQTAWQTSTMVNQANITADANGVTVPTITVTRSDGRTGTIDLRIVASGGALDNTTVTIKSKGQFGAATNSVTYNMTVQRGASALSDYAVASKGSIQMTGNASIRGLNNTVDGSILSATYSTNQAITMTGNDTISGNVVVCNPDGTVRKTGNISIGGQQIIGAGEPQWPQVDITPFKPYATNTYSGNGSGTLTLSNITIPPNTNPTFSGNVTVYGVIYIKSPNRVSFSGNCNIIGTIVTDTPAVNDLTNNSISFTGNISTSGVDSLPSGTQYDGLRALTGSFLLAPGFAASFTGNFNTVNGCMVASQYSFTGNAGGTIQGGLVCLRDSAFTMTGNTSLVIDRQHAVATPAGIVSSCKLVCLSGSFASSPNCIP